MKVVKKVQLHQKDKDGNYIKSDTFTVLRHRAVIQESSVIQSENTCWETGILYIIDEDATEKFLSDKKVMNSPKSDLQAEYKELTGEDANGTWGVKKLSEVIESIKNK